MRASWIVSSTTWVKYIPIAKERNGSQGERRTALATHVETIVVYLFIYLFCAYPMFRTLLRQMLVVPVAVRSDNYAYLLIDQQSKRAAVVDPFDMQKVQAEAERIGVDVVGCLTTHYHHDHSGGNHVRRRSHLVSRRADDVMDRPYRTLCVSLSQRERRLLIRISVLYLPGVQVPWCTHLRRQRKGRCGDRHRQGQGCVQNRREHLGEVSPILSCPPSSAIDHHPLQVSGYPLSHQRLHLLLRHGQL